MPDPAITTHCRVCAGNFFAEPLLSFSNMPAAAQGFPTADTLAQDQGASFSVMQCSQCGLVQLDILPVPYYREVIRATAYSPEMREVRLKQFAAWVEQHQLHQQAVLEIGCGKGEYLNLLQASGVKAFGIEASAENIAACQAQSLAVELGFLGETQLKNGPFLGFACFNFMEHWPNPNAVLQALHAYLAPGAVGLIEVPNFDMMIRERQFSEFISDHLLYFTEDTLRTTLSRNGFEVLSTKVIWHDYILSAEVRKRGPIDLSGLAHQHGAMTKALQDFVQSYEKVAIWGAGHQALATIALADIAQHIDYVVDSAPFKQGRFTPATHLPIVGPNHLLTAPPDAVIIMAAGYSDEVAQQLRAMPIKPTPPAIGILRQNTLEILAA